MENDLRQYPVGELQAVIRRAASRIHRIVGVIGQIGRPAQPVAILILRPLHAEVACLQPVKDHLVVGIGRCRAAVIRSIRSAALALCGILNRAIGLSGGSVITRATRLGAEQRRSRQTRIAVMRRERFAQIDRRVIDVGGAHHIHHIHAEGIVDIVAQPDVTEILDQDPPLHIVGMDHPVAAVFIEGQGGQILGSWHIAGNIDLLRHRFGHVVVENRIDGGDPTIRHSHLRPVKTSFRPINRPHLGRRVRRHRKGLRGHAIGPSRRRQGHPGDLHPPRLRGVDFFRVRAVIIAQRRRHCHRRRAGDRLVGRSRQGDVGATDRGDRLAQQRRAHHHSRGDAGHGHLFAARAAGGDADAVSCHGGYAVDQLARLHRFSPPVARRCWRHAVDLDQRRGHHIAHEIARHPRSKGPTKKAVLQHDRAGRRRWIGRGVGVGRHAGHRLGAGGSRHLAHALEIAICRLRQCRLVTDRAGGAPLSGRRAKGRGRSSRSRVRRENPVKVASGGVVRLRLDQRSGSHGKHGGKAADETGVHDREKLSERTKKHLKNKKRGISAPNVAEKGQQAP